MTLIELLIVIIIIGAVYMLFISGLGKQQTLPVFRFENLQTKIRSIAQNGPARLLCSGETCNKCTLTPENGEPVEMMLFNEKPKVFAYDRYGYLQEVRFGEALCFDYHLYENQSSDNILVEREGKYYLFYALLKDAEIFDTYDDAVKQFDPMNHIYLNTNDYYYGVQ